MTPAEMQDFVSGLLDDYGCAIETGDRSGATRYRTLILRAVENDERITKLQAALTSAASILRARGDCSEANAFDRLADGGD